MRRAAVVLDIAALVLFVSIGRASHHDGVTVAGFISTVWPFAVGLGAGWLLTSRRLASVRSGALVAAMTVGVGMALRVVAGQGTAAAFVVVAVCFLGAVMVGGRSVLLLAVRRARRSGP